MEYPENFQGKEKQTEKKSSTRWKSLALQATNAKRSQTPERTKERVKEMHKKPVTENKTTRMPEKEQEARCSFLQSTADRGHQSEMKSVRKWKSLASQVTSKERQKTCAGAVGRSEGGSKLSKRSSQTKFEGELNAPILLQNLFSETGKNTGNHQPLGRDTGKNNGYHQPLGRDTGKHRQRDSSNTKVR